MIRVLNIVFHERLGGPLSRILQVANLLRAHSVETIVATPHGGKAAVQAVNNQDVELIEIDLKRPRQSLNPVPHFRFVTRFWPSVRALRSLIRTKAIQIVHTNGLMHAQAALAAHLEGVKLVWHINDFVTPKPFEYMLLPLVKRWADGIAVSSRALADHYFPPGAVGARPIRILYPPVDTEAFRPGADGTAVRAELGIPPDDIVVGTIGNLSPIKGTDVLIAAAPSIIESMPTARFLIVGAILENRRRYWRSLVESTRALGIESRVIFAGRRDDLPQLLAAMNLYVHPSRSEGGPMAVIEAGASGLPVVVTDVGGTPELIKDGESGVLVAPDSPKLLAEAILRILGSPETARRMGMAGREHCRQFAANACARVHLELYRELLP